MKFEFIVRDFLLAFVCVSAHVEKASELNSQLQEVIWSDREAGFIVTQLGRFSRKSNKKTFYFFPSLSHTHTASVFLKNKGCML